MDTKNANAAHFWQVNHKVRNAASSNEVEVLESSVAWDKYTWVREYFDQKPKEGYFIWVKKQPDYPLISCVSISKAKTKQQLSNLLVVNKNLKVNLHGTCNSMSMNLKSEHNATGKIILREGSSVDYLHIHSWGNQDKLSTNYDFILEKNSKLNYKYKTSSTPKLVNIQTKITLHDNAKSVLEILADCTNTKFNIHDITVLQGDNSSGISKIKLVGRENADICARSQILASGKAKGHLECNGLMIDDTSKITLIPRLDCENKDAELTHEASVGKISEEQLTYLRMRGLTEEQALNLIVAGFLDVG